MSLNYDKMSDTDAREHLAKALNHFKFSMELCVMQHQAGRMFLFEHPVAATSWGSRMMQSMVRLDGVQTINFDFCSLGMQAPDGTKNMKPVKKRTKVMTNSGHIAAALAKCQCSRDHDHVRLEGGKASACEVYPRFFCELIVKGLKREIEDRKWLSKVTTPSWTRR